VDRDGVVVYNQAGWDSELQFELRRAIDTALKRPSNPALLAATTPSATPEPTPQEASSATPGTAREDAARNPGSEIATPRRDSSNECMPSAGPAPATSATAYFERDMRQAEILRRSGHLQEAIEVFRHAIQSQPNDVKCHRLMAETLVQKGDRAAAIVEYQGIVKLEPDNAENHFVLGAQLEARGASAGYERDDFSKQPGSLAPPKSAQADYQAALEQYQLAHRLAPLNPAYTEAYARMKSRLGQD